METNALLDLAFRLFDDAPGIHDAQSADEHIADITLATLEGSGYSAREVTAWEARHMAGDDTNPYGVVFEALLTYASDCYPGDWQ